MSKADRQILWGIFVSCLPRLIGFILALVACALIMLCCGCKTQKVITETVTRTDTLRVRHDSIIVRDRYVPVEVPIPVSSQVVDLLLDHDSTSVLEDDYYISTAKVVGGRLQHTLQSKPKATLTAPVIVHDTTYITQDTISTNNVDHKHDIEIKEVNKLYWWQKWLMVAGGIFLIVGGLIIAWKVGTKYESKYMSDDFCS